MARLPYQGTVVDMYKTHCEIKKQLYSVGFSAVHEIAKSAGDSVLVAEYNQDGRKVGFEFRIHTDGILSQLPKSWKYDHKEQAAWIAWRLVFHQVKALCDSVRLEIVTIAEAFGGNLLLQDKTGEPQRLADWLTVSLHTGSLTAHSISDQFLIEDKR